MTLCDRKNVDEMSSKVCEGFNVLQQRKCSNLNYEDWERFFDEKSTKEVIETLNDSHIVHFWSSQSDSKVFHRRQKAPSMCSGRFTARESCNMSESSSHEGDESKMHEYVIVSSLLFALKEVGINI